MRYWICLILLFISIDPCLALGPADINCTDANTFCADSCALEDVQHAADEAMGSGLNDTIIYIPPCSPNPAIWEAGAKLALATDQSRTIRLLGSGQDTTQIIHFQIDVPNSTRLNLVELGHLGCNGNNAIGAMLDYRLRPEECYKELYWHDFSVKGYTGSYTLTLEGWFGVISNLNMVCTDRDGQNPYGVVVHGDGVYSDHTVDFGTRNAFFIEDSTFDSCSHTVSSFCDGFVVFRNNTIRNADSHTDLHGPGYNYCYYNKEEKTAGGGMELYDNYFYESQTNWVINARAGQGHIYTNNRFDDDDYRILLYWDLGSNNFGNLCGTDTGETCGRCDTLNCPEGCSQAQDKTYIWDNDGTVIEYIGGGEDDCLLENETYFLRSPSLAEDGFDYTPFTYPHPLVSGSSRTVDADTHDGSATDEPYSSGEDGLDCFISSMLNGTE